MDIAGLQEICNKHRGVTEGMKWEDHLCFMVGEKMFLITAPDHVPHSASLKVTDEDFEALCTREGIIPAPYLARYKWVHLDDIGSLTKKEWERYIRLAYDMVFEKLPAKIKKEISGIYL